MQMRNVQRKEVQEAAEAWNNVKLILARKPRMFITKPGFDLWVSCTPEFDDKKYPGRPLAGLGLRVVNDSHHEESKQYFSRSGCAVVDNISDIVWSPFLENVRNMIWDHNGTCVCGRRTYLFGLCPKCMKEDAELQESTSKAVEESSDEGKEEGVDLFKAKEEEDE
jgi:hypothetical protein